MAALARGYGMDLSPPLEATELLNEEGRRCCNYIFLNEIRLCSYSAKNKI